jgi:acyl carrier protein
MSGALSSAEQLVAQVYAELFRLDRVEVTDDLFELGGDSMTMTMAIGRIEAACGVALPLSALFPDASVRSVAARLEEALAAEIAGLSDAEAAALLGSAVPQDPA